MGDFLTVLLIMSVPAYLLWWLSTGYRRNPFYWFGFYFRDLDLSLFSRQLGSMLAMKLPAAEALQQIAREYRKLPFKNRHLTRGLEGACSDVGKGHTLAQALARQGQGLFPDHYLRLVQAAESGEHLPAMLLTAADSLERRALFMRQMMVIFLYPLMVLILLSGVAQFLVTYILPTFVYLFEGMGIPLPFASKMLLMLMKAARNPYLLISIVVTLIVAAHLLSKVMKINALDWISLKLPFLGKAFCYEDLSAFSGSLGTLLENGFSMSEGIALSAGAVRNTVLRKEVERMAGERGAPLSALLRKGPLFNLSYIWMIKMGEKSETLDSTLKELAVIYGEESRLMLELYYGWLKPATIVFIGFFAALIIFGTFLPMVHLVMQITRYVLP